ncbi:MAG: hydrogenase maturation nickel metallochaperone HypA [Chloroflexi bacterium]|nr:hydrogenase maturation nickel metallochaperone HypA [Chloroflexota bacterium]
MHEIGIAQDMLRIALDYAAKHHAKRILGFHVEMSALADESDDALRFHLDMLTRGTLAEGARIEVTQAPVQAKCFECGNDFQLTTDIAICPRCSSMQVNIVDADEFRLASIEIE